MATFALASATPSTANPVHRRALARSRLRRGDLWIAATALVAAFVTLPLARTSWHGPEVAATLAVAATALAAGQRWAVSVVVIAELLLLPTVWPLAFLGDASTVVRVAALVAMIAVVPGLLAMRRAAAALVLVSGRRRTQRTCRRIHAALALAGAAAVLLPLAA